MNAITQQMTSEDLIELLQSITVPVSKIKSLENVIQDPLVKGQLLFAKDPITSRKITLAPPPIMNSFINDRGGELTFPPRFGEHNNEIYGQKLGYDEETLGDMKSRGII
jgi:crotonobetainyl-CoA:carnitine CoA-transferase CaiB-like acyl-CoA transferase